MPHCQATKGNCEAGLTAASCDSRFDEASWSGAAFERGSDWHSGHGFWLNEVYGEEVVDTSDPRLRESEKRGLDAANDGACVQGHYGVVEFPVDDPRSLIQPSANNGTLGIHDLNHNPSALKNVLLTSFDFVDDVAWLQSELRLARSTPLTLCTHSWPGHEEEKEMMLSDLHEAFDDAVVHFPGEATSENEHCSNHWQCSVHAKLMLLEFTDRLRVVVTSANLKRVHWRFRGEVIWVQDFPHVFQGKSGLDARQLLDSGQFALSLAHFVADLLNGSEKDRQSLWTANLARFDFAGANACLIISLPGLFCPTPRPPKGGHLLRLTLHGENQEVPAAPVILRRTLAGVWELISVSKGGPVLGYLDAASRRALDAAMSLGFHVQPEVTILPTGSQDMLRLGWSCPHKNTEAKSGLLKACYAALASMTRHLIHGLPLKRLFRKEKYVDIDDHAGVPLSWSTTLTVRATLSGVCSSNWVSDIPTLLTRLDSNYGLVALEEQLEREVWLDSEEQQYVAITGSIGWPDAVWCGELDRVVGRAAIFDSPGPLVIAPSDSGPLDASYAQYAWNGKLIAHTTPHHAPTRDQIPNHAKLLMRQFWDTSHCSPYGWIYVGSHNLTKSAWGEIIRAEDEPDRLWISNRELGVLLVRPRGCQQRAFADTPLPFGLPLVRADIRGREIIQESWYQDGHPDAEEEGGWWKYWHDWGWWYEIDSDDELWSFPGEQNQDWRMRSTSQWWWV